MITTMIIDQSSGETQRAPHLGALSLPERQHWLETASKWPEIGVTRVGDVTDLDDVGLPVWFACRPNSMGLSQTQGKGLTDAAARVSALMEAAEHAHAEKARDLPGCRIGSVVQMKELAIPLDRMSMCRSDKLDPDQQRLWCPGRSLFNNQRCFAPYELIGLDFRLDQGWDRASFRFSTVGLGAGLTRDQAILHALFELVENDATLLLDALSLSLGTITPLHVSSEGPESDLCAALRLLDRAGVSARFGSVSSPFGLPVVSATLDPIDLNQTGARSHRHGGFACRTTPEAAALAALLEAVQSRCTDIAGARDDIPQGLFEGQQPPQRTPQATSNNATALHQIGNPFSPTEDPLKQVLARLRRNGVRDVYCFDLMPPDAGYAVVRLLCPDLGHVAETGPTEIGVGGIAAIMRLAERLT